MMTTDPVEKHSFWFTRAGRGATLAILVGVTIVLTLPYSLHLTSWPMFPMPLSILLSWVVPGLAFNNSTISLALVIGWATYLGLAVAVLLGKTRTTVNWILVILAILLVLNAASCRAVVGSLSGLGG